MSGNGPRSVMARSAPAAAADGPRAPRATARPRRVRSKESMARRRVIALVTFLVIVTIWEGSARLGLVDSLILSAPSDILREAYRVYGPGGEMYPHLLVSSRILVIGFLLASVIGIVAGVALGASRLLRYMFEPYVMALYSTPQVALFPLLILLLGIGPSSKIALVFLGSVFPVIINTQAGVLGVEARYLEMSRSFTATRLVTFRKVVLPAALPMIVAGLRLAVGRALVMVFVAELFSSTEGVGYVIVRAGAIFNTPLMFVGVLTLTIAGVLLSRSMKYLERRLVPYLGVREKAGS